MKTPILLCWLCPLWSNVQPPTTAAKPVWTQIHNNQLLDIMTAELTPNNLQAVYGSSFWVEKGKENKYEPGLHNTLLVVNTPADKLKVFKNKYNTFLLSATLTSQRLAFGRGIRVGATKAAFCKAFNLSPKYDGYQVLENPEGGYEIDFYFKNGVLAKVTYETNYVD